MACSLINVTRGIKSIIPPDVTNDENDVIEFRRLQTLAKFGMVPVDASGDAFRQLNNAVGSGRRGDAADQP